jgi:4-hydroxy-tetrahydrodipicolinate synthase
MVELKGIMPALTTPFKEDRSLDLPAYRKLIDILIGDGVHSVLVNGCTGESWALDDDERAILFEATVHQTAARVPVVAGCGAMLTKQAIAKVRQAEKAGCDAAMIQPPWYVMINEEEVYAYYKEIMAETDLPVMIYNIPRRTGINFSVDLVDRLADHPKVIALKESSKDWLLLSAMIRCVKDRINVLAGYAPLVGLAALAEGAVGFVDSASLVLGNRMVRFYEAATTGDMETARRFQAEFSKLTPKFMGVGTFPASLKVALDLVGRPGGWPRDPVKPLNADQREQIRLALIDAGLLSAEVA